MKTIICILVFAIIGCVFGYAQTHKWFGNKLVMNEKTKVTYEETSFTTEVDGVEKPIYITSNGRCFVYKTSHKTNKDYKKYLHVEVSKDICTKLNREFKENPDTIFKSKNAK